MKHAGLFITLALMLCTASANEKPEEKEGVYRGEYFYNFENSFLTPQGKNEAWCISSGMSKAMLPPDDKGQRWGTSDVVVRGKLGPEGHFGGLGRCKRVLEVTEVIEVKNMRGRNGVCSQEPAGRTRLAVGHVFARHP